MTSGYFKKVLKDHGWKEKRMDGGGYLFTLLGPKTVTVDPLIRELPSRNDCRMWSLTIYCGVATPNFNWYCDQVEGRSRPAFHHMLADLRMREQVAVDEWTEDLVLNFVDRILSRASSIDLEAEVTKFCEKPDHLGWDFTVNKFVSLRLRGKDLVLRKYLADMKSGQRPDLNPGVTAEMIERTLEIDVSGGLWAISGTD